MLLSGSRPLEECHRSIWCSRLRENGVRDPERSFSTLDLTWQLLTTTAAFQVSHQRAVDAFATR